MSRISRRALPVATVALARYLIGKLLVHRCAAGRIAETEAYPPGDPTGYARPGLTISNAPLFAARGTGRRRHCGTWPVGREGCVRHSALAVSCRGST